MALDGLTADEARLIVAAERAREAKEIRATLAGNAMQGILAGCELQTGHQYFGVDELRAAEITDQAVMLADKLLSRLERAP
jgi:hypothetical protein